MYWGVPQNVWLSFTSSTFLVLVTFLFWPLLRLIWYIWILAFYPHLVAPSSGRWTWTRTPSCWSRRGNFHLRLGLIEFGLLNHLAHYLSCPEHVGPTNKYRVPQKKGWLAKYVSMMVASIVGDVGAIECIVGTKNVSYSNRTYPGIVFKRANKLWKGQRAWLGNHIKSR